MIAADVVRGDMPITHWTEPTTPETVLLDVRSPGEFANGHAPGAVNYPLESLRDSLDHVPPRGSARVLCSRPARLCRHAALAPARNPGAQSLRRPDYGPRVLAVTKG